MVVWKVELSVESKAQKWAEEMVELLAGMMVGAKDALLVGMKAARRDILMAAKMAFDWAVQLAA